MNKDVWKWIERIISIGTIIGLLVATIVSNRELKTTVRENKEYNEKVQTYIDNQNVINGKFDAVFNIVIGWAGGTPQKTEEEGGSQTESGGE